MTSRPSRSQIISTGIYLPDRILTNRDIEKFVDTNDEWITSRTGIKERRIAGREESTIEMGSRAAKAALDSAGLAIDDIDLVIASTISPDHIFPSTACSIQGKLGGTRKNTPCFDVQAACTGFIYAMVIAEQFLSSGSARNALIIGTERLSSIVDWTDRSTCVLFGDGAGAIIMSESDSGSKIIDHELGSNGQQGKILFMEQFNSQLGIGDSSKGLGDHLKLTCLQMSGKEVFKQAVTEMERSAKLLLGRNNLTLDSVRCIITHQANSRIIDALASRLQVPEEKCFVNLDRYGNISTACIPVALHEAKQKYDFKKGDIILLVAFGGGLTWGSILLKW